MLETDEIDDDYFTPISSTSLANIFGNTSYNEEGNTSLKYTPEIPKPKDEPKSEESRTNQCIFACVVFGYEWFKNVYISKGKLGFATLKIPKTGCHNIVLYDSNKTTLSCTTISSTFEVTVKGNVYISYYDDNQKYWSLYASEKDMKNIVELFNKLDIVAKHSPSTDKGPPEPSLKENPKISSTIDKTDKKEKDSDTDSSINRKTKTSILNRMASMGQSILPPYTIPKEKTSDSSDTNETNSHSKVSRYKTVKNVAKRNQEKNVLDTQSIIVSNRRQADQTAENVPVFTYVNGQLVPITNTNGVSNTNSNTNDINSLLTEQRINNSELRINMNRVTDKVDQILDSMKNLQHVDQNNSTSNFQNEILQKLLTEYENKIKIYEEAIKSNGVPNVTKSIISKNSEQEQGDIELNKNKITELEQINKMNDLRIAKLQNELDILKKKYTEATQKMEDENSNSDKIKSIMNDTFRAIAVNFKNNESYSGEDIKSIIATVIKKVTIESLNEL